MLHRWAIVTATIAVFITARFFGVILELNL
jgi:hypothetical protein